MSWQLGTLLVLGLGLVAGFAWYERTRPDARTVALVGTLAAFATLGRIAFAALPNVKPTTDIVLISGFALGGAPGYVVGAVAGLTSNFFFGQGPWTPWQMAGWGAVGVLGALLARITRGRIGRWRLGLISFVVGLAFTALQDAGNWVMYSDHSLRQLGAYVGSGFGFDLIDAFGCLGFALAFGPAMISTLARFRRRLHVSWLPGTSNAACVLLIVLLGSVALGARPQTAAAAGDASPIQYLRAAQNPDGGFGPAAHEASTPLYTGWAVIAGAGGQRAGAYLARTLRQDTDPGSLERTILAVRALALNPARFGGEDLVTRLERDIAGDGSVSEQCNLTAFAVLALRAAGAKPAPRTVSWIARQEDGDGGFNYATRGGTSDVDDTAAVIQALAGTGHAREVARAAAFIVRQQNPDGGFPSSPGGPSNAQSTAFAVQGLIAAGESPKDVRRGRSRTPLQYLRSLILPNGAVDYAISTSQTPVWVTAQVELALTGRTL